MDAIALVAAAAFAAAAGAVCWLAAAARAAKHETTLRTEMAGVAARLGEAAKRMAHLEREVATRDQGLEQAHRDIVALKEEHARLATQLEGERQAAAEKLALLEQAEVKLKDAFATLSSEALRHSTQSFLELAKASLGEFQKHATLDLENRQQSITQVLEPLKESLQKVDAKLQDIERDRTSSHAALAERLHALARSEERLQVETARLVQALRAPAVRGRWGEIQLRRVVELAGMVEYCDFEEHPGVTTENGRLIPDLIVRLPGGRNVIVDAKVPIEAYMDALETEDDEQHQLKLRDHARQVRDHIARLSAKAYWEQFRPTPEFVCMFLPSESFFSAALQHDPTLVEFGAGKGVIVAGPLTLIALLRAVAYGWQEERRAKNAEEIGRLARDLYERIRTMAGHFEDLEKALGRAVESYSKAVGSLESRVLVTARRFRDLGVAVTEEIPQLEPIDHTPRPLQAPELTAEAGAAIPVELPLLDETSDE